jgi:DNA polymerase-3 subunit delta
MAARVGVSPYFIKEYLQSLRYYDLTTIEKAFAALLAADFELKGGANRDERLVLNLALQRLMPNDVRRMTMG